MPTYEPPARAIKGHHLIAMTGLRLRELTLSGVAWDGCNGLEIWCLMKDPLGSMCRYVVYYSIQGLVASLGVDVVMCFIHRLHDRCRITRKCERQKEWINCFSQTVCNVNK